MARKMLKLFGDAYLTAPHKNYHGFPSFERTPEERALQVLTTGVFENTFYAQTPKLVKEALEAFGQMATRDAKLFAQMIVYARNEGLLRTVPITALAILSYTDSELFARAFPLVIRTPNDLKDFVMLIRRGDVRAGLGRSVKRAVNAWLNDLSPYHAIKYGSRGSDATLRDVLRLTHPQPKDARNEVLFSYLVNGLSDKNSDGVREWLPQVWAFEQLKRTTVKDEQLRWIAEGRLPYEAVVGALSPDAMLWSELMKQMPLMALLRHVNTLARTQVLSKWNGDAYVAERLSDRVAIERSKVLPFRFYTALQNLDDGVSRRVREAIEVALEHSFANTPTLPGVTCIAPDVSGSMRSPLSGKGKTRYVDIAAIFAAACLKHSHDSVVLPFEHRVVNVRLSSRDSLMTTAEKLARIGGGGTAVASPITYLLEKKIRVDTFIGITDNEDWCYGWDGKTLGQFWTAPSQRGETHGFLNAWRQYKAKVNPHARAFLLTIAPYRHAVAPPKEAGVYFVYGWSDAVLPFIAQTVSGEGTQLDAVRRVELDRPQPIAAADSLDVKDVTVAP